MMEAHSSLNDYGNNEAQKMGSRQTSYLSTDDEEDDDAFRRNTLRADASKFDAYNETRQIVFPVVGPRMETSQKKEKGIQFDNLSDSEHTSRKRQQQVKKPLKGAKKAKACAPRQMYLRNESKREAELRLDILAGEKNEDDENVVEGSWQVYNREALMNQTRCIEVLPDTAQNEKDVMNKETGLISRQIKKRECSHFISASSHSLQDDKMDAECQCGYTFSEHSLKAQAARRISQPEWNYLSHSEQITTDAFGEIEFLGGQVSKYIRVDADTKTSDMWNIMEKEWGLHKPNLLISVTGGSKDFHMSKQLKETLRQCFYKTTLTTGAWIVTAGTHAGVTRVIGKAVEYIGVASMNQITSIGIASWGCIQNKEALIGKQIKRKMHAKFEKEQTAGESILDPNHTHFILVDNATQHKYGVELNFRVKLEKEIAETKKVLLVVNGGLRTLETVSQSLRNDTPSVIVKGSGRAANILAYAYQNAKRKTWLLIGMGTNRKTNTNGGMYILSLALAWNRIDLAKNDIFVDDRKWPPGSLDDLMLSALQLDRTDFVELFFDHGVSLRQFLTENRRRLLYNTMTKNSLLRTLLDKKCGEKEVYHPSDIYVLINKLISDSTSTTSNIDASKFDSGRCTNGQKQDSENHFQELFLMSVLMLKQEMTKLFWLKGKDAIAAALVAYMLFGAIEMETEDNELLVKLQHYKDEWSVLAVGILSKCYSTNESMAHDLLVRELSSWGYTSCILIALQARNIDFISQTACQSLLNRIWMGKLLQDNASWQDHIGCCKVEKRQPPLQKDAKANGGPLRKKMPTAQKRIYYFFKAPVVIFMGNLLSYFVFLGLYSYILLFNFKPSVSSAEIVLMVWVFTIFLEEIRQAAASASKSPATTFKHYFKDVWNKWDVATIGLFVVGIFLRFFPNVETFDAARVVLAINFVSFCLRLLQIFALHKILGPKLVMIGRMVKDLMSFLVILMVFIVSYAIASHSILFPNSPMRWSTASDVIRKSYWHIYGELFLEEIEGSSDCTNDEAMWMNGTLPRCPSETGRAVASILLGLYMLLANILLLNLLIAMFSNTFALVQKKTNNYWCFQRCSLIYEYHKRPVLSPPLNIFWNIYLLLKFVYSCCCCEKTVPCAYDTRDELCRRFKNKDDDLEQWEHVKADSYLKGRICEENDTNNLLKRIINRMDEIQEQQQQQQSLKKNEPDNLIAKPGPNGQNPRLRQVWPPK